MRRFLPPAQPAQPEEFVYVPNNRTLLRYCQKLYQHFSYASNFGLAIDDDDRTDKHGKPVLLSRLFVSPKLSAEHVRPEQLLEAEHGTAGRLPQRQPFPQVLREHQRLFILGDPGTGKSTLISWLMLELSYSGDNICKSELGPLVPFAFVLRDMRLSEVRSWDDLWQSWQQANPELGQIMAADPETTEQVFGSGQGLFLLDGLDEISNQAVRAALGRAILDGMAQHPRCRFVLTSRLLGFSQEELLNPNWERTVHAELGDAVGVSDSISIEIRWADGRLAEDANAAASKQRSLLPKEKTFSADDLLPVCYLSPFDLDQVGSFCANWHSQYVGQALSQERVDDLLARLRFNDGLARLARIPVLLNIICFIHARRGRLPDGRSELYQRIAETYLVALDRARGIRFRDRPLQFDFQDLHGWLGKVALKIQQGRGEKDASVTIEEGQVAEIFRQGIEETGLNDKETEEETQFILDYIAERSGLFIPRGRSAAGNVLYAFTHLSFMEYFAAVRLRAEAEFWDQNGEDWENMREWMQDPAWKEVFVLFFELMESPEQTECYLARLVGSKPDIAASKDSFMPVPEQSASDHERWQGGQAWVVLAGIVMDTAVKFRQRLRKDHVRRLWQTVLSKTFQKNARVEASDHLGLMLEHLWSEKLDSLTEFRQQAAELKQLLLAGRMIEDLSPLSGLSGLQSLSLSGSQVSDLRPLSGLSGLQSLSLSGSQVFDLRPLSGLSGLQSLSLSGSQVSDLRPLSGLSGLQSLDLSGSQVSDLSPLSTLSGLQSLDLRGSQVSDLSPLSDLSGLQRLDLRGSQVSDLSPLSDLSGLQSLDLSGSQVSDLSLLSSLSGLQSLHLSGSQVSDLSPLSDLSGLQRLLLSFSRVSDLSPLSGLSGLQRLDLIVSQVSDLSPLSTLSGLQHLQLIDSQVSDLRPLSGLSGLQSLSLRFSQVSDLSPLKGLSGLQRLDLRGSQVSDLRPLSGLSGLQSLDLSGSQISDLRPLSGLSGLQSLDLSGSQVSDLSPLSTLSGLQSLDLSGSQVSDLRPLSGLSGLQSLDLSDSQVSDLSPLSTLSGLRYLMGPQGNIANGKKQVQRLLNKQGVRKE